MQPLYDVNGNYISLMNSGGRPLSSVFAENQLIAHKGGNAGTANTIANFEAGIANGYKMLEGDVRFTSDSVPVLSHDASVSGYTIASYTYDQIHALVPTLARLDDFLNLCKQNNVVAELDFTKEYNSSQTQVCYDTVESCGMLGRATFTAYANTCRALLTIDSDIVVCVSGISSTSAVDNLSDIISAARLCVCSTDYSAVTAELVEYMHSNGCLSKPWTVNSVATINTLFGYGADYIITDSVKPSDL